MDKEHRELLNLLEEFLREFKKKPVESGMILEKFNVFIQKHFSVEEVAIFTILDNISSETIETTFELMKEHQEMMALLKKIETELGEQVRTDVIELERVLRSHRILEDEQFYPRLEEELNENQKAMIISKIKEKIQ
jgi:hemerythrin-like domain-containing protein